MSVQPPVGTRELPLLSTKLYIPPVRREQVARPRLIERLDVGVRHKLTLVSAPAGFGKTTLVSAWAQGRERVAWLALDAEDNDPMRFWRYVVAALLTIGPTLKTTLEVLHAGPDAPQALLAALINDVAPVSGKGPLVLVLDDYHLIDAPAGQASAIHEGLEYLLDHLPPALHLVLTTREDPPFSLSRLRGRGQLVEIRAADLRFTPQETAEFLNATMGLGLSAGEIAALESRTEGWIVGLQMAALSLQRQTGDERARFVTAFAGDDRYVADYLIDEVLRRQPPHIQSFLLQTSILERLCGPLCDALLAEGAMALPDALDARAPIDGHGSPSQAILEHLNQVNLFVVSLDSQRRWFRYHRLFAELLCSRFEERDAGQVSEMHVRASAWYERQGFLLDAISHVLKSADVERVADLVVRRGGELLTRGEYWQHCRLVNALPEAMVRSRPLLCLARAWAACTQADETDQDPMEWMERALELSAANPRPLDEPAWSYRTDHGLIRAQVGFLRHCVAAQQGDLETTIVAGQEALEALPEQGPGIAFMRGTIHLNLGQAYTRMGDLEAAERAFSQAGRFGQTAEGHVLAVSLSAIQAFKAWERGDLHAVARICHETIDSLIQPIEGAGQRVPQACYPYVFLGRTLLEWNELDEAEPLLLRGTALAEQLLDRHLQATGCRALARLHWIQGQYAEAQAWMDKAVQACQGDPDYLRALHALRARIWLAQAQGDPRTQGEGDHRWLDRAIQWADARVLQDPGEYDWELQSLVRVRIAQYRAYGTLDLGPVQAVLEGHIAAPAATSTGWQVEVNAIHALLLDALGWREAALAPLARALTVAQATGRVVVFLEHGAPMYDLLREAVQEQRLGAAEASYARQLLAAFEARGRAGTASARPLPAPVEGSPPHVMAGIQPAASAQAALVDPLSSRELQVLRLLATTLSGPEIADELTISLSTFRSHTKSIYSKLDVHSRLDAVARAGELGLLSRLGL